MMNALIFDCDGVLADTELHGHLVAFNQMWRENGVDWQWCPEEYADKVKIGGGKERMFSLKYDDSFRSVFDVPDNDEDWWAIVTRWHQRKSEIYKQMTMSGALPARPGVKRLAQAALNNGWIVAVCSTSSVASVRAVLDHVMGKSLASKFAGVFAGDMVQAKKPAPDVYNLAVNQLKLNPTMSVAIEDTRNGLLAATAAGLNCVVTYNPLSQAEDFSEANMVLSGLGDPGGTPITVADNHAGLTPRSHFWSYFSFGDLKRIVDSGKPN